jgi:hypothetical protein
VYCGRPGGIPARNSRGERLLLFIGIIDILQSYRLKKKLEHTWKAMIHDGVSFTSLLSSYIDSYCGKDNHLKLKWQHYLYSHQACIISCAHISHYFNLQVSFYILIVVEFYMHNNKNLVSEMQQDIEAYFINLMIH